MQHQQQHVLRRGTFGRRSLNGKQMRPQRQLARQLEAKTRHSAQRRGQLILGDARGLKRKPHSRCGQHLLPRHPGALREHGAQALVTAHQIVQRALKRTAVERPRQPHRDRDRIGPGAG